LSVFSKALLRQLEAPLSVPVPSPPYLALTDPRPPYRRPLLPYPSLPAAHSWQSSSATPTCSETRLWLSLALVRVCRALWRRSSTLGVFSSLTTHTRCCATCSKTWRCSSRQLPRGTAALRCVRSTGSRQPLTDDCGGSAGRVHRQRQLTRHKAQQRRRHRRHQHRVPLCRQRSGTNRGCRWLSPLRAWWQRRMFHKSPVRAQPPPPPLLRLRLQRVAARPCQSLRRTTLTM
jgi:hypothetical protein